MSLKTKLFLLVGLSIAASVGAVAWLIEERAHESFRRIEEERTAGLVNQFRREFDHEGQEIARGMETIATSDSMLRSAIELSGGSDYAPHVNDAAGYASAQRLDFLDLIAADGTIISSAHWPARFGFKQRWFLDNPSQPQQAFLRQVETAQGSTLALLCLRPVRALGTTIYLLGGRKLDAVMASLSPPPGMRVSIYSAPEDGSAGIVSIGKETAAGNDNLDQNKLTPLIEQAINLRSENSGTIEYGAAHDQEAIVHAIPLAGYADRVPAVLLVSNSLEQEQGLERRIRNVSLIIAALGVLVGVTISGVLAARLTRPINELAEAAADIAKGRWDVQVEPRSQDEVGRLATAFNRMTEEIVAQRDRLVQSERVAAWRELARRLAHELKNPLFPLQITVENLLRARENTPQQFDEVFRESTATLLEEIANLKNIIARFSDFSKMPAPQFQNVDLDELVRSVAQLFQSQLSSGPARIEPELELGSVPPVSGDPVLLRRVVENLVLNAIDAMPQGGRLAFRTSVNHRSAVLEISDTGSGLTPEECQRLFTPYYTTRQHGTGLGLAIVQSVVSDHHGKISVTSAKNAGTTFRVELPLVST
ncbi:MAG TPA: ATP-binding protein [Candidatus Angelobacter sp.]|nr:ATP-binding protein [Candidatus Angelobacter sp.]